MTKLQKIKSDYESACNAYIDVFTKKHGYYFTDWVSNEVGGIACFVEQYYFSIDDIRQDVDMGYPKGLIFEWHEGTTDAILNFDSQKNKKKKSKKAPFINLKSYAMGLRYEELDKLI